MRNLTVEQIGSNLPTLSWSAPNGTVAGYLVYVGPDASKVALTASPITGTTLTDTKSVGPGLALTHSQIN